VVSNGYVNPEPLRAILPLIDAFNIDLKAFTNEFYQKYTKGKLEPVLQTLKTISQHSAHLEITNLIIPGLNDHEDEFEKMINWIATELGTEIPLHLSRYFPQYDLHIPPTPVKKMEQLYTVAKKHLQHVYVGNVSDETRSATYCQNCKEILISRNRFKTTTEKLSAKGECKNCGVPINIIL
jgi:pyruvate formate lyase activating enzyme